jgi:hypothetical protein
MKPSIWKSRKFWIMVWDVIISLVTNVGVVFLFPEAKEIVKILTGILQAPVLLVIGAIAYEDAAYMNATLPRQQLP